MKRLILVKYSIRIIIKLDFENVKKIFKIMNFCYIIQNLKSLKIV